MEGGMAAGAQGDEAAVHALDDGDVGESASTRRLPDRPAGVVSPSVAGIG
jgi:hypothetical protein